MSPPNSDAPEGSLYRRIYLPKESPRADSKRMRNRLASLVEKLWTFDQRRELGNLIDYELGLRISRSSHGYVFFTTFFQEADIVDALSAVTVCFNFARQGVSKQAEWLREVRRIFTEENVRYRVDDKGGVHPLVDTMFELLEVAAVKDLGLPRYANALAAFKAYQAAMDKPPTDGKAAIRGVFEAAEIVFKLAFPRAPRLARDLLEQNLGPALNARYARTSEAQRSSQQVLKAMGQWVDAAHHYRHGQGSEEPTQPPFELAIQLVSAGTSYVRWLIEFDQFSLGS